MIHDHRLLSFRRSYDGESSSSSYTSTSEEKNKEKKEPEPTIGYYKIVSYRQLAPLA